MAGCLMTNLIIAQTCTITGKIIDSKTLESIPFANVFLNNTTLGTVTEINGEFSIKNVHQPSVHELVISFVGYETYKTKISLTAEELKMGVIRLKPSETELSTVEVKGTKDVDWEKKLKRFKKIFLGDDVIANQCSIKNAWVINFKEDGFGKNLIAFASAPIEIENNALGYKVNFYLNRFTADNTSYVIQGNARFESLISPDEKTAKHWEDNRENSYYGSSQHLFKSFLNQKIHGEGFNVYTDMLGFENSTTRSSQFRQDLGKTITTLDTTNILTPTAQKDVFKINWKGKVEVHYRKEKTQTTIYQDIRYPISWITSKRNFILVNKEGVPLNPSDIVISGAMSEDRVANMLPIDYLPPNQIRLDIDAEKLQNRFKLFYEKIYIHTDKAYYYPGETIWLKGYMNYVDPNLRDSLSKTVYVELIDGLAKKIVQIKTLKIDSGFFHSDIILPDTLKASPYFIRAYTSWNRNYGDDHLYTFYVPVLNLLDRPEVVSYTKPASDIKLKISSDKLSYKTRDKIELRIELKDDESNPIASNLSVSVTDANQVVAFENLSILENFPIKEIPETISKPSFPIEYGISFSGRVFRNDKNSEKSKLNIFQTNMRSFFDAEANENGIFSLRDLNFYDSARFTIKLAKDSKGKLRFIRKIDLLPRQIPSITFNNNFQPIAVRRTQSSQREKSSFETSSQTKLLKEILVKSTKIDEATKRPYGKPDYVITAKDINTSYGNLLTTLPGKVPGLVVRQDPNGATLVYIARANSIETPSEVTVLVNDVFVGGSPAEILGSINPSTVESVEVKTGINVLYGVAGGNGIVSVYTKKDSEGGVIHDDPASLIVPGYSKPRIFPLPDNSKSKRESDLADYRSLIYWNASVRTNSKTGDAVLSFYATDLTGPYRVEIKGVTSKGEPLQSEYLISVTD